MRSNPKRGLFADTLNFVDTIPFKTFDEEVKLELRVSNLSLSCSSEVRPH